MTHTALIHCDHRSDSVLVAWLAQRYKSIRRARNDGNCFFRGFAFSFFEYLLTRGSDTEHAAAQAAAQRSKDKIIQVRGGHTAIPRCRVPS